MKIPKSPSWLRTLLTCGKSLKYAWDKISMASVSTTGSLTVTSATSVQFSALCLTGLTLSLPASVPSQKRGPVSSACPPPNVIWQNKSISAHANNPAEGTSWAYEWSCGGGNITALNSGCLCVRLWTQRRGCLSCFFCLLCILLSICSLLWCLACLSCSFLAFLFCFLSMDPHLPLIFSYSLFDISFWVVVSPSLSFSLSHSLSPSLSLTLSLSLSLCLCLFDALLVGWMTEAIRLFRPHTHAKLSCPVLRC